MQHISSACHLMRGGWLTWSPASRVATTLIYPVFVFFLYFFFPVPKPPPPFTHPPQSTPPSVFVVAVAELALRRRSEALCLICSRQTDLWGFIDSKLHRGRHRAGSTEAASEKGRRAVGEGSSGEGGREGGGGCGERGEVVGCRARRGEGERGGGFWKKKTAREWWNRKQVDARRRDRHEGGGTHTHTHLVSTHAHTGEMSSNQNFFLGGALGKWKKMAASLQGSN